MYVRQTPEGRFPRSVRVPQNYSGNAFREMTPSAEEVSESIPEAAEVSEGSTECSDSEEISASKVLPSPGFRLDVGRLFHRRDGGIGAEELLILGLILLLAGGERSDEILLFLILLLFIQ